MRVTEEDLRSNYEALDTEQLLELRSRGTLTDSAARLLEQVLEGRSVSGEERLKAASEIQKRLADERELIGSLASLSERAGAQLIDSFLALMALVVGFLIAAAIPTLFFVGVLLCLGYLLFADGFPHGQSIGKRALGIAVIDQRTRKPCSYGQSFLRNLLLMLMGIIDWLSIFGRTRQRLGDMAASTIVVRLNHTDRRD